MLAEGGADSLIFAAIPGATCKQVRSTYPQGRHSDEVRLMTDVVGICPNRAAVHRLINAVVAKLHDEWAVDRRYHMPGVPLKPEALTACMRKLLTILNAMVKTGQRWTPQVNTP